MTQVRHLPTRPPQRGMSRTGRRTTLPCTAAMLNLLIFELVDLGVVFTAACSIAHVLSGGAGTGVVLAISDSVDPGSLPGGDEVDPPPFPVNAIDGPDGIEWPDSPWRSRLAVPAWDGKSL